jgi:anti-anti-sigma factor
MSGDGPGFYAAANLRSGTLHLGGDFDTSAAERFDLAFAELQATPCSRIELDLGSLEHLSSTGLGRLIDARRRRPDLVLRNLRPEHRRLLEMAGIDGLFRMEDDDSSGEGEGSSDAAGPPQGRPAPPRPGR